MGVPAHVSALAAGTRFGRYRCLRPLAAGGMSELYLAAADTGNTTDALFVIKRLLPHLSWDPEFVRMFLDEVKIAASLEHPNVVRVLDFGVGEGGHYFAMEHLHGRDVRTLLREQAKRGPMPLAAALGIVLEAAHGLHYVHEQRDEYGLPLELVHRDVSPANVFVGFDGRVTVLDFGIARATALTRHTKTGTIKGKIGYMSPEQCLGRDVDRRSDIFGLGIMLYELTVNRRAFFADNDYAVINHLVEGRYALPSKVREAYPAELEQIVVRALAKDSDERYPTAADMIADLERFAADHGLACNEQARIDVLRESFGPAAFAPLDVAHELAVLPTAAPHDVIEPTQRSATRMAQWVGALAAVALVGVGGFSLGALQGEQRTVPPTTAPSPSEVRVALDAEPSPEAPAAPHVDAKPVQMSAETTVVQPAAVDGAPVAETSKRSRTSARAVKRRSPPARTRRKKSDAPAPAPERAAPLLPPSLR